MTKKCWAIDIGWIVISILFLALNIHLGHVWGSAWWGVSLGLWIGLTMGDIVVFANRDGRIR